MAGGAEILFYGKIEKFTSLVDERSNSPEGYKVTQWLLRDETYKF